MPAEGECKRFYAVSKRIPKGVKRYCNKCKAHGLREETKGHTCPYSQCFCDKCGMVDERRSVMKKQIQLRRVQDKRFQRTTNRSEASMEPMLNSHPHPSSTSAAAEVDHSHLLSSDMFQQQEVSAAVEKKESIVSSADGSQGSPLGSSTAKMCYVCQKCKNHGQLVYKKNHKRKCPHIDCPCDECMLIDTRRKIDMNMKQSKDEEVEMMQAGVDISADHHHSIGSNSGSFSLPPMLFPSSSSCSSSTLAQQMTATSNLLQAFQQALSFPTISHPQPQPQQQMSPISSTASSPPLSNLSLPVMMGMGRQGGGRLFSSLMELAPDVTPNMYASDPVIYSAAAYGCGEQQFSDSLLKMFMQSNLKQDQLMESSCSASTIIGAAPAPAPAPSDWRPQQGFSLLGSPKTFSASTPSATASAPSFSHSPPIITIKSASMDEGLVDQQLAQLLQRPIGFCPELALYIKRERMATAEMMQQ